MCHESITSEVDRVRILGSTESSMVSCPGKGQRIAALSTAQFARLCGAPVFAPALTNPKPSMTVDH